MYFLLIFTLVFALIIWKIIYDFSLALFLVPLALFIIFLGYFLKQESPFAGLAAMAAGVAVAVWSILNRDISIGVFVDNIPNMIMFWKK